MLEKYLEDGNLPHLRHEESLGRRTVAEWYTFTGDVSWGGFKEVCQKYF